MDWWIGTRNILLDREVFGFLGFGLERKLSENFSKNQGMSDLAVPLKSHQVGHEVVGL